MFCLNIYIANPIQLLHSLLHWVCDAMHVLYEDVFRVWYHKMRRKIRVPYWSLDCHDVTRESYLHANIHNLYYECLNTLINNKQLAIYQKISYPKNNKWDKTK